MIRLIVGNDGIDLSYTDYLGYPKLEAKTTSKLYDELRVIHGDSLYIFLSNHKLVCTKCHLINEYAEPNQKDGSYICFNCR